MKLCFKILFCFYVVLSLGFLDASNDSVILDENVHDDQFDGLLSSDGSVTATQEDKDIRLVGYGRVNLTLDDGELIFKVCSNCAATSRVCFETAETGIQTKLKCSDISTYCTFKVRHENGKIFFGDAPVYKEDFGGSCLRPKIHSGAVQVVGIIKFDSCEPKIVDKMIKLYVSIDSSCPITVINAKIHAPPTTTTSPTKVPSPTQSPDSAETSSFPDWGYIILATAALIIIGAIIGCIAFYVYKRRQSSIRSSQKPDETKPKATVFKADVPTETPTKKNDDLESAKAEQTQIPKKEKKTKTQAPTTTEDAPIQKPKKQKKSKTLEAKTAEEVPPPTPFKQLPPPNPAACYPLVKRLIPRGMKSAKTDSLDETLKKDKTAMVESLVVSAGKHCLKGDESDVLAKMKADYPMNVQHVVLPSEVDLLCFPVSKMYEKMNTMAQISELKLAAGGCEFDESGCMLSVSDEARQFLKRRTTDATTVYHAFGAEYYQYITGDLGIMDEASIPLLYSIALQTRFPEATRRKACAALRRKLVKVLGWFKAADRAKMPFPVNIVENAYCKNPRYFYEPSGIKTDSRSDQQKKQIGGEKRKRSQP